MDKVKKQTIQMYSMSNPLNPMDLREARGPYTQSELAVILEIATTNIQAWEAGSSLPTMGSLRKLLIHWRNWRTLLDTAGLQLLYRHLPKPGKDTTWPPHKSSPTTHKSQSPTTEEA